MAYNLRKRTLPKGFWGKSTGKSKARKAVRRMKPATKTAVKAIVKQVMDRNVEDKFKGGIVENSNAHGCNITAGDIYPVLPPISQGTDYNERVGNKIRPKRLEYRLRVALNESANLTTPYHVDIWVLTAKRCKSYNLPGGLGANIPITALLDGGNGVPYSYDGSTMHALLPLNKEYFTSLGHRRFKLTTTTVENHKGQSFMDIVMRVKCPKSLIYDGLSYPENFAPFTVCGWSRDDGVTPDPTSLHVTVTGWSILYYEDA